MTVKQAIDIIDRNTDKIFSVIMVDGLIDGKVVASHQDDDDHRWYTTATRVYQVDIYHSISSKYLQRYVDEAVYRWNTRRMSGCDSFRYMFKASIGVVDYEMVKQVA